MLNRIIGGRGLGRSLVLAGIVAGSAAVGLSAAVAGECPADKMKVDARAPDTKAAKGVTDTVLAAIDLEKEPAKIKDRQLRFRRLTIEPGGIVPWHSHGDRPAIIYIAEGEIVEYASNCAVPIVHKSGGQYEDVLDHGKYGLIYEDDQELAEKIEMILTEEKRRLQLKEQARTRASMFTTERFSSQMRERFAE